MSMSTSTTSFSVSVDIDMDIFPTLPPTMNSLDPEERSRLLRSTRKLGRVLGATPFVLELPSLPQSQPQFQSQSQLVANAGAKTPSPKKVRREGGFFHSPSSSISSISTTNTSEPDYVLVKSNTRSAPYQHQSLSSLAVADTPRPKPRGDSHSTSTSKKRKGGASTALPPIALVFDIPGSGSGSSSGARSSSGPTGANATFKTNNNGTSKSKPKTTGTAQPLLLHVRPALERYATDSRINTIKSSSNKMTEPKHSSPALALSPVASSFNVNMNVPPSPSMSYLSSPTSPTTPTPNNVLSERERRRKMAKLTRTLGENIPPELVFRSAPSSSRRASVSRPSQAQYGYAQPTLSVASNPIPPPRMSSLEQSKLNMDKERTVTRRRNRPRSLTLGSSSAIARADVALTRGTASLDVPSTQSRAPTHSHTHSTHNVTHNGNGNGTEINRSNSFKNPDQPFVHPPTNVKTSSAGHKHSESIEFGRRKEREWSGEWNLKDMEDVARRLRGLKGR